MSENKKGFFASFFDKLTGKKPAETAPPPSTEPKPVPRVESVEEPKIEEIKVEEAERSEKKPADPVLDRFSEEKSASKPFADGLRSAPAGIPSLVEPPLEISVPGLPLPDFIGEKSEKEKEQPADPVALPPLVAEAPQKSEIEVVKVSEKAEVISGKAEVEIPEMSQGIEAEISDVPKQVEEKIISRTPDLEEKTPTQTQKIEYQESLEPISEKKGGLLDRLKPSGWFSRLKKGLDKTRKSFVFKMKGLFRLRNVIDEDFWEELEDILITADVGLDTTEYIIEQMKKSVNEHFISEPSHLFDVMKEKLGAILEETPCDLCLNSDGLSVVVVVGVNGTGKTTSIAKIANRLKQENKKVLIAAADTFRAAAIEQLEVWGGRLGLEIIKHKEGADPAAVVFDAVNAAIARKADVLIIDTAGRLHSKVNLMNELEKIKRVIQKTIPDAPHETLIVLDATTGQNALIQAKTFSESVNVSGIVLTKLDGTAKGGIVIGIVHDLKIPVKFIGVGEAADDLRPFEAKYFLDALFNEDSETSEKEETLV